MPIMLEGTMLFFAFGLISTLITYFCFSAPDKVNHRRYRRDHSHTQLPTAIRLVCAPCRPVFQTIAIRIGQRAVQLTSASYFGCARRRVRAC